MPSLTVSLAFSETGPGVVQDLEDCNTQRCMLRALWRYVPTVDFFLSHQDIGTLADGTEVSSCTDDDLWRHSITSSLKVMKAAEAFQLERS